ncbi:hypothetical protein [Niastella populi]|uniref:hypothetical protein n=1 Tax=Niastella populi TaxID=550983 RepID=UPI001054C7EA|nr:hypothetical protein [Niastella populi]
MNRLEILSKLASVIIFLGTLGYSVNAHAGEQPAQTVYDSSTGSRVCVCHTMTPTCVCPEW